MPSRGILGYNKAMEGWLSGPKRGIANPLSLNKARTGSNPVPSALRHPAARDSSV